MEIKKTPLEQLINESIDDWKRNHGFFSEDKFTIHCGEGFEVQVIITSDDSDFLDEVHPDYAKAGEE